MACARTSRKAPWHLATSALALATAASCAGDTRDRTRRRASWHRLARVLAPTGKDASTGWQGRSHRPAKTRTRIDEKARRQRQGRSHPATATLAATDEGSCRSRRGFSPSLLCALCGVSPLLFEGARVERFSSKLSGSGSAGAARRRTSVRRARRAPRRARSTTRKSALVRGGLLRADDELDPAIRGATFDRSVVGDRVARAFALRRDEILRDPLRHEVVAHRGRAVLRERAVHVERADVVSVPVHDDGLLFALEGLGDLVELRHRAALQVVLSGLEEDLALERDDHAAVVILDRRDLGDRIAGILELRLHVRQLGGLGGGRGLLLLELHLGLAEGRSRLAELPVRVRQLRGGHDFALGL